MYVRSWLYLCITGMLGMPLTVGCSTGDADISADVGASLAPLIADDAAEAVPDRYIVVLDSEAGAQGVEAAIDRISLQSPRSRIERSFTVIPGFVATLSPEDLDAVRRDPAVAHVERDQVVRVEAPRNRAAAPGAGVRIESDFQAETVYPLPGGQPDGIDRVDQPSLPRDSQYNDHGCDGTGVRVYVIDTGVRSTHTDFGGRVDTARGFSTIDDGLGTEDCIGQGTHIASTIAGAQFGMAKNATLVPVRVINCFGSGTFSGIIAGLSYVASDCGEDEDCVANMNLGGGFSAALNSAVASVVSQGIEVVVPVGSNGCSGSPASEPSATGVAGLDDRDCRVGTSLGSCVDIFSPNQTILGADHAGDTASIVASGMSGPAHMTGAMAQALGCGLPATEPLAVASTAVCMDDETETSPLVFNDFGVQAPSCAGRCGTFDRTEPCQCDASCASFGDCCADFVAECPCLGNNACGGSAGGCFCDASCERFGDCCPDGPC